MREERLSIGYLVQQFPPEVGAGPARVSELGLRWLAAGARLTVVTAMPNRPEGRIHADYRGRLFDVGEWQGIRVLRSWLYASPKPGFARTLLNNTTFMLSGTAHATARLGRCDVLIASSPPFFPHLAGALIAALKGIPLVLEVRDLWPDYLVGMGILKGRAANLLFAMERWLLRRAARVVVITESFERRMIEKGVPAERIAIISNGVDTMLYDARPEPPPLPELVPHAGETVVGYLGNFGAGQGLSSVIEAAERLGLAGAPVRFVLAGDGPEREQLLASVEAHPAARVSVHRPIPKEQTRAFYNACDICLVPLAPFPILQETVPSKLFEAMACERPIIACLEGEARRILEECGGGRTVPPGDAAALAEAIEEVRQIPPEARRAMGQRARAYASAHFDRDALARRYLELLEDVAREQRKVRQ